MRIAQREQKRRRLAAVVNGNQGFEVWGLDPIPAEPAPFRRILWRKGFPTYGAALQHATTYEEG